MGKILRIQLRNPAPKESFRIENKVWFRKEASSGTCKAFKEHFKSSLKRLA